MNGACLAYQPDNPIAWPYDVPSTWSGEGWLDLSSSGRDLPFFWKGEELPRLYREANRFWLPTPNGGWRLAGVMVETVDGFGARGAVVQFQYVSKDPADSACDGGWHGCGAA